MADALATSPSPAGASQPADLEPPPEPSLEPAHRGPSPDISPKTQEPGKPGPGDTSYFPTTSTESATDSTTSMATTAAATASTATTAVEEPSPVSSHRPSGVAFETPETSSSGGSFGGPNAALQATARLPAAVYNLIAEENGGHQGRRKSSISFQPPRNPNLPQGHFKPRPRFRSPEPVRFRRHVGFDNIPVGEPTKHNTLSLTLSISHHGYQPRRRSRTMMVGIDQHGYSDYALKWLLDEYADDGDEIICVHVTERDATDRSYKARAETMVEEIKKRTPMNRAVSIKLEYCVGKLHSTFQSLFAYSLPTGRDSLTKKMNVYHPVMLVVGTKGRSLGGFQGLVNTNSFSKYCLQYSPIPTVVVRDNESRQKKKDKRSNDPTRQTYAAMLPNGKHESDMDAANPYELEARISADEEAHHVATAIGLPAAFDPTAKHLNLDHFGRSRQSSPSPAVSPNTKPGERARTALSVTTNASADSDDDDSEDEPEFGQANVKASQQRALQAAKESAKQQKKRLHEMEVGEAAALKKIVETDDDDDDDGDAGKA